MQLQHSTWEDVARYLERSTGVIIPTGSTEQHGPNGLIGTDALCAEVIARGVGAATGGLVGPTLAIGPAQFNLGFPGSINARPSTLMALAEDYVRSLAAQGFERFYFLNGHGGNIAPLKATFQQLYTTASLDAAGNAKPLRCRLRSWWELPQTNGLRQALYGQWEGLHATPSEVAITQHAYPDSIRAAAMDQPAPLSADFLRDHAGDNHDDAHTHRRRFPDGRVGSDPSLANPADGKRLVDTAVAELAADYQAFLAEAT